MIKEQHILYGLGAAGLFFLFREIGRSSTTPTNGNGSTLDDPRYLSAHCPIDFAYSANSANFQLSEFHSKDGVQVPLSYRGHVQRLMNELEKLRFWLRNNGYPNAIVSVNSGYRSPSHNRNEGGASQSQHLCATAADIRVPGLTGDQLYFILDNLMRQGTIYNGGLGRYTNRAHYDLGLTRRWDAR